MHVYIGVKKAIRELKRLRRLDLSYSKQVDNSVLETAVSVLESDVTRQLFIDCEDTSVNAKEFKKRFKGTRLKSFRVYAYKNLEWYD